MFSAIGLLAACLFAKCSGAPENITFAGNECFDADQFGKACPVPGNLGDGYYTCLVKERATCYGRTYVKEGSVCRDTHWYRAGGKEVLQCTSGLWQWKDEIVTGEQDGNRADKKSVVTTRGDGSWPFSSNAIECYVILNGKLINQKCNNPSKRASITVPPSSCTAISAVAVIYAKSLCTDSAHAGSVCHYVCNPGYRMTGSPQTECLDTGSWSHSLPSCHPISCGNPGSVSGGSLQCVGTTYGSSCVVFCNPGYVHSGSISINCTTTGTWTQADMCIDIERPKFPSGCPPDQYLFTGPLEAPVAVTWTDPVTTDNSGQNVTLTSSLASGSELGPGDYSVTITATDVMGNQADCCFNVVVEG